MNSCDSEVFPGFVFSITWHSKLVDSLGKTLVVFCHCQCESREENLFWEAITSLLWHVLGKVYLCFRAFCHT